MALKDTLEKLKEQQNKQREAERKAPQIIEEWQRSVDQLFSGIRGYLSEYETGGLMVFSDQMITLSEEALGSYQIKEMDIQSGGTVVEVKPVGRIILGATGRVDMHVKGKTLEDDSVILLRAPEKDTPNFIWRISTPVDKRTARRYHIPVGMRTYVLLTKASLEEAVNWLLS